MRQKLKELQEANEANAAKEVEQAVHESFRGIFAETVSILKLSNFQISTLFFDFDMESVSDATNKTRGILQESLQCT